MKEFFNLAVGLATNSTTFFIGSGFSKYLTDEKAPNWIELLAECTKQIDQDNRLFNQLFNQTLDGRLSTKIDVLICAQILELEFKKKQKDIRKTIAEILNNSINDSTINKTKVQYLKDFFEKHKNINFITTNYDSILSDYILPNSRILIAGNPISKLNSERNIFHIHGSIKKPTSIVLTLDDYFTFQNEDDYFSRKFYTLLQETSVAILGYSLGDFNLNSILHEIKNSKNMSFQKSEIFYVIPDNRDTIYIDFYSDVYKIDVIRNCSIDKFFGNLSIQYEHAKELLDAISPDEFQKVLNNETSFNKEFLELQIALHKILTLATANGINQDDTKFLELLISILNIKKHFTKQDGAWEQYVHLASWLIDIASIIKIENSCIQESFMELVDYSLSHSSKEYYTGYSWNAYKEWYNRWAEMKRENQILFETYIKTKSYSTYLSIDKIYTKDK